MKISLIELLIEQRFLQCSEYDYYLTLKALMQWPN